ncbi:MAG TPA: M56 family metallopeptidase [Candidatus Tidjanibacter gallistercoris]|nr:M56 family metallopeptidase [Candidatus Tidjanibacter gallistercoris]
MKETLAYLLEALVSGALLTGAYTLLLERRAPFVWCRRYLLFSIPATLIIPLLRIPVWPAPAIDAVLAPQTAIVAATAPASEPAALSSTLLGGLYLAGTAVMLGTIVRQMLAIDRLRRRNAVAQGGDYEVVRIRRRIAAFSFRRRIYLWEQTPERDLPAILAHERSHIRHRHSEERIAMECLKALCWWNPFAWTAACKLTEVQEYEADSDVLALGFDRSEYMKTVFRQLLGYSPDITSGLQNSLTKKRFTMMTEKTKSRYGLLRAAATLSVILGLVCAFGFTTRAAELPAPAQTAATAASEPDGDEPFLVVEQMPRFQGGDLLKFRQWVEDNVQYPAQVSADKVEGRVLLTFVVDRDGSLTDLRILESSDVRLSEEVVRTVAASPAWQPGRQKGELVRVQFTLPVIFRLTD